MSCCYVTSGDGRELHTSSVLRENHFFDREADCCRAYSDDALQRVEKLFLESGISFSVQEERRNPFARVLGANKRCVIVRVHEQDMEDAMDIAGSVRGVEVTGIVPEEDWSPVRAKRKREEERRQAGRFRESFPDPDVEKIRRRA